VQVYHGLRSITIWTNHAYDRQFKRLSTMEISDFGCFLILTCGVVLLQRTGKVVSASMSICNTVSFLYCSSLVLY